LASSPYIRAMHPKTEIRPDRTTMQRVIDSGWVGQLKIHGHRAQIHLSADEREPIIVYNRQRQRHKRPLSPRMERELRRLFQPQKGWTALDAEWLKPEDKLFVFDALKWEGKNLSALTYPERWALLPRDYISNCVSTLRLLSTLEQCMKAFSKPDPWIEGLVFKSTTTPGFSDTSIVRCRKRR